MNDKITPMAPAPQSTPAKDTPVETKVAPPGKVEEPKLQAEPEQKTAVKS